MLSKSLVSSSLCSCQEDLPLWAELSTDLVDLHSVDLDFEPSSLPTEGVVGEVSLHLDHQTVEHSAGDSHKDV